MDDQEPSWPRQLLIGLGSLLAVGALVGAVIAVVAVKAADYAGVGQTAQLSTPGPVLPSTGSITQSPTTPTHSSTSGSTSKPPPQKTITLQVSPQQAGSYEKVNLTGTYPGHDGTTLQVQRSVGNGAWSDFPTTTHVTAGKFATYIKTGMVGLNHLRMMDPATGKTSNVANVTIG